MSGIFEGVHDVLSGVFMTIWPNAQYIQISGGEVSRYGEPNETPSEPIPCKAQIDDSMSGSRSDGDTVTATRYVMILVESLSVVPAAQDKITITPVGGEAETFTIVRVTERDPANTYYRVEVEV